MREGGVVIAKVSKKQLGRFWPIYDGGSDEQKAKGLHLVQNLVFIEEQLTQLQGEIREKGVVSEYQNGENQWGTRKSPEVDVYNALLKNYISGIKQLNEIFGEQAQAEDELTEFLKNGRGGGAK
ncbi:hypothetical protein B5F22_03340 [Pseudoflavonifractor sp. An187]|nr:hypothetical protein B5F22_03340 [Pseudoflavonifractor sp. An187]